jgi:hypothetical protein
MLRTSSWPWFEWYQPTRPLFSLLGIPIEAHEIVSPYFTAMAEERRYQQFADKAFEEKSRIGSMKFVNDRGIKYRELGS